MLYQFLNILHVKTTNIFISSVQDNLDRTADLIAKLDAVQSERLSQVSKDGVTPKSALKPSENEQKIGMVHLRISGDFLACVQTQTSRESL